MILLPLIFETPGLEPRKITGDRTAVAMPIVWWNLLKILTAPFRDFPERR
jgi:hypothetical protein